MNKSNLVKQECWALLLTKCITSFLSILCVKSQFIISDFVPWGESSELPIGFHKKPGGIRQEKARRFQIRRMLQASFIKVFFFPHREISDKRTISITQHKVHSTSLLPAWSCFYPNVPWWDNKVQLQVAALLALSARLLRPARHPVGQEVADGARHRRALRQHRHR